MFDPALTGPKRLLHVLLLVLLPSAVLAQPAVALLATTGPGAEWIELGEDGCGASCCCPPADCPCEVTPKVPADAPLPQFAPEVSIETWRILLARLGDAQLTSRGLDDLPAHVLDVVRPPPEDDPPPTRSMRTLSVRLAVLQTALL